MLTESKSCRQEEPADKLLMNSSSSETQNLSSITEIRKLLGIGRKSQHCTEVQMTSRESEESSSHGTLAPTDEDSAILTDQNPHAHFGLQLFLHPLLCLSPLSRPVLCLSLVIPRWQSFLEESSPVSSCLSCDETKWENGTAHISSSHKQL